MGNDIAKMEMEKEIEAAVDWWAKQFQAPKPSDNGDLATEMMKDMYALRLEPLTPETLEKFKQEFRLRLPNFLLEGGWENAVRENNPSIGSYCRCLVCDYGPCGPLRDALEAAGVTQLLLRAPMKTYMWINPGNVKTRLGYHADEVTIYDANAAVESEAT